MTGLHSDKFRLFFQNYKAQWINVSSERLHKPTVSCNISTSVIVSGFGYNYKNQKEYETNHLRVTR